MGGKSSGGGRTPREAADSLRSAQRLRAIGLISLGLIKGTVNKWKSTYFDNTPIQNANGVDDNDEASFNFKNTEIQFNLGTQDQLPLEGFEASEREVSVGAEVKQAHPLTRSVIDPDVTRIRLTLGVNALFEQNNEGDTNGTSVRFEVLINGQHRQTYDISGKSSSRFFRCYMLDNLPPRPFEITVKRVTADSKSQRLQNATTWVSYTEIIDTKLSYPNMALVGVKTDSRYNPNFPNMNFLLYGRIIKVPSTYDPETRTYAAGIWKGDWKLAWTNNPAWIFYDLITNPLVGLGDRIGDYGLDKFQLYQIAQYCDELVDDGYGGKEPRMVANLWLTEQRDAYQVVSDMASVFRAIAVWNGTQFTAIQDRPTDPVCTYSQSNVVKGKFARQYVAQKAIYTAVEVEYADERNMYQKTVEYVADDAMIARYGYNVKKITAFACTSRGQARRYGKWVLETSRLEQCTISFSVGRQGLMHLPGDIIEIADNHYAGQVLGGRVVAIEDRKVTLDQPIEITGDSYLAYLDDEMTMTKVKISQVDSQNKAIIRLAETPAGLNVMDDWVLQTASLKTERYRAIGITENDDGSYTITALQHEPQKETIVDGSASFMPVTTTTHGIGLTPVQNAAVSADGKGVLLSFTASSFVGQGLKYQVKLYRDGKLHEIYDDLPEPNLAFSDLPDGAYVAEIRAKNASGQLSEPTTTSFNVSFVITELVTVPKVLAIELNWKNPLFANSTSSIELWVSEDNQFQNARKLVTLAYPTNSYTYSGLGVNNRYWFWARMVDGNSAGQFTDPVEGQPEQSAVKLTEYLNGQITKDHLGQELIQSLKNDIDTAVGEEAKTRQEVVANALSQITAQAQHTGTAIRELQNADSQQAQQLATITAKAESALSGITAEQQARVEGDKVNADKITAITARMGTAESLITNIQSTKANKTEVEAMVQSALQVFSDENGKAEISQVSQAVSELNSKLSATHTVKTQVLRGGRTVIAGIALGATADNKTTESSVIVMADKFGVVKNANDGDVIPMLSVVNNKVAVNGDLIADGTILGKHLKANETITAPTINGGTIKGTNIIGNSISGGSISGTTISGGTVSGTTITAATIDGGVINGATGTFRGTLYAENIIGDLVKMYFCNRGGTVKIPAMTFARKVCILPFMIYANNSSSLPRHVRASEVIAYIKRNGVNLISTKVTDSNGYGTYKMVDGDFDLPVNTEVTLGYDVNFRGDDTLKAPSKIGFLLAKI